MNVVELLLKGLSRYPIKGTVGETTDIGRNAYCVGLAPSRDCLQAATTYGSGRIVAFGHNSYITYTDQNEQTEELDRLIYNSLVWGTHRECLLTNSECDTCKLHNNFPQNSFQPDQICANTIVVAAIGRNNRLLQRHIDVLNKFVGRTLFEPGIANATFSIEAVTSVINSHPDAIFWTVPKKNEIIIPWPGPNKYDSRVRMLLQYVQQGGSVLTAMTPWSWQYSNDYLLHDSCAVNNFLIPTGIRYTDHTVTVDGNSFDVEHAIGAALLPRRVDKIMDYINNIAITPTSKVEDLYNLQQIIHRTPSAHFRNSFADEQSSLPSALDEIKQVEDRLETIANGMGKKMFYLPMKWPQIQDVVVQMQAASALYMIFLRRIAENKFVEELSRYKPPKNAFPGTTGDGSRNQGLKFSLLTTRPRWQPIGLYCPAGEMIKITISSKSLEKYPDVKLGVNVGAHWDTLLTINPTETIKRHGAVSIKRLWNPRSTKKADGRPMSASPESGMTMVIGSIYGGAVYIEIRDANQNEKPNLLIFEATGGVFMPLYSYMKEKRNFDKNDSLYQLFNKKTDTYPFWTSSWEKRVDVFADAPLSELEGRYMAQTIPSAVARKMKLTDVLNVMDFWDRAMYAEYYLAGNLDNYLYNVERFVYDPQPALGYLHSGYPIVAFIGMITPPDDKTLPEFVNVEQLKTNPPWGAYHECGHNMQEDIWTWEGVSEVTCNIFSMYCCNVLHGYKPLDSPWIREQLVYAQSYLNDPSLDYDYYNSQPGVAGVHYAIFLHHIGDFEKMRQIFINYKSGCCSDTPSDKRDLQWVRQTSLIVKKDLRPFYREWRWPVDDPYLSDLDFLPEWHGSSIDILDEALKPKC